AGPRDYSTTGMIVSRSPDTGAASRVALACAGALLLAASAAHAQSAPPPSTPVFIPGFYEIEDTVPSHPGARPKLTGCIDFADYAAFRDHWRALADFRAAPGQLQPECRFSPVTPAADGFTFSTACRTATSTLTYMFEPGLVLLTVRTVQTP